MLEDHRCVAKLEVSAARIPAKSCEDTAVEVDCLRLWKEVERCHKKESDARNKGAYFLLR